MAKIVIIGLGHVGLAYLENLIFDKSISGEVVLIDNDEEKLKGEILDIEQGLVLNNSNVDLKIGDYSSLDNADICVLTLGLPQSKKSRLEDLAGASKMVKEVTEKIENTSFNGIILVATNPVDVISQMVAANLAYPYQRVIGTGTMLDTIRLKSLISKKVNVSPDDINVYVLGEHGNSQFVYYNNANISMSSIKNYLSKEETPLDENGEPVGEAKEKVEQMFQTDKADGVQPVKVEQLTLDVNQNQPEQPVQPKNVKIQEIRMTEEELQEQRRKSFEKLRGGADKGKKSKFQFDSSWISKPLGILALITMHVLIDNFIICVETVFYYLWYGDLLSIKEELITCSVCLAFFFILLITKGIPVACDGIMELFCDIKSTFINEEKN